LVWDTAAFQVVTRAVVWALKHALKSSVLMYVDDIMGVRFVEDFEGRSGRCSADMR
jgi:hypothetical protein